MEVRQKENALDLSPPAADMLALFLLMEDEGRALSTTASL